MAKTKGWKMIDSRNISTLYNYSYSVKGELVWGISVVILIKLCKYFVLSVILNKTVLVKMMPTKTVKGPDYCSNGLCAVVN